MQSRDRQGSGTQLPTTKPKRYTAGSIAICLFLLAGWCSVFAGPMNPAPKVRHPMREVAPRHDVPASERVANRVSLSGPGTQRGHRLNKLRFAVDFPPDPTPTEGGPTPPPDPTPTAMPTATPVPTPTPGGPTPTPGGPTPTPAPTAIPTSYGYTILVRRHVPAAASGAGPTPTPVPYSSSATVAAGGVARDEHQADIEITVSPPDSGVTVPIPSLLADPPPASAANPTPTPENEGAGVNNVDAVVSLDSTTTDNDGKVYGHYRSSNKLRDVTLRVRVGTPEAPNPLPPVVSSAVIHQEWNDLEGSPSAWDKVDYFVTGEASPLTYSMTVDGGIPITGHSSALRLKTMKLTGLEWDPDVGDYVPGSIYTQDDPELQDGGIYSDLMIYDFFNEIVDNAGNATGDYTTNQTINDYVGPDGYVDYFVDAIEFDILDYDAYKHRDSDSTEPP